MEPREEQLSAATLFVDIAGYTPLVEQLREEGSRGAERTQEILNRVFGPIASVIENAGGEVLRFPGDAALALFTGHGSTDVSVPVRRASVAAQAAIHRLNESPVQDGVLLRLRVAIGAGHVWIASLGGVGGRFELLVRGGAVDQLSGALALARPGEIVLSAEAARLAGGAIRGSSRGGALCLESVEAAPVPLHADISQPRRDQLEAFVPRSVRVRLAAGQREFFAELRRVTVVFVHLPDFDTGATDAHQRLQEAFVAVQHAVERFGGSVNQVVDDGKGIVFLLGFGLALHAHEDDGLRATSAALEIRERLVQQGLDPRL
ncbi:MAG: adenylate/guanylate cyclase domain-containing protein, partial [Gemmatimonadota bacterium]|nr:adenylate/guanylate cyclase domain-containing protein [Gemmatimonadota bacterium]